MSPMTATTQTPHSPQRQGEEHEKARPDSAQYSERRLPTYHLLFTGVASAILGALVLFVLDAFSLFALVFVGFLIHLVVAYVYSRVREGRRWAMDRLMTLVITGAFVLAMFPLVSLLWEVARRGAKRFFSPGFLTSDQLGVYGGMVDGGIMHAIVGTLMVTLGATLISVPIGFFTSIFLVEYASQGPLKLLSRGITFLVDVMTGIPSIVAGLFGLALFTIISGDPGMRTGLMGSVALSVLMIPTVVRSSEEMLRLVPLDLREAAYALGTPKWLTIVNVVLRTAIAGLATSVTLAIARVIGETAPLLLTVGAVRTLNADLFDGRMQTLPTYINTMYKQGTAPCPKDTMKNPSTGLEHACSETVNFDNAWAAALTLIIIVMLLNIIARVISYYFSPKLSR